MVFCFLPIGIISRVERGHADIQVCIAEKPSVAKDIADVLGAKTKHIGLIDLIHEELLKSAELTGIWEKRLREIERGKYQPAQFMEELKQMVTTLVHDVLADNSSRL